jgi:Flp pilus assembly protein TadB
MNKFVHAITVQRGEKLRPLTTFEGDFIYKESERHLASDTKLSDTEIEKRKENQVKNEANANQAYFNIIISLLYLLLTVFVFTISTKIGAFLLVIGILILLVRSRSQANNRGIKINDEK